MTFLLALPGILLLYMVFLNICKQRFSIIEIVFGALITYGIASTVFIATSKVPGMMLVAEVLGNLTVSACLAVIAYRKTEDWFLSGYYALFTLIIGMIGNAIATISIVVIFATSIEDIRGSLFLHIVLAVLTFPICYAISRYAGKRLHQSYIQLSSMTKEKFVAYTFMLSAITYLLSHFNILVFQVMDNRVLISSINVILLTFIFFVAITMLAAHSKSQQKQMEAEYKNKALEDLENYTKNLEQAYDEMHSFRHDHLKFMDSLMGFANGENQEGLKNFLIEKMNYTAEILDKLDSSMDRLKFIHIPELKGLLSVKFAHALAQNIDLEIDLADPIKNIPVNRMDLCRLVGIMVDNAIEDLLSNDYENKALKFGILLDDEDILIICSNTCKTPPDVERIFTKNYSTKGSGRGLGLYNLKKIAEKCENIFVMVHPKENEFSLILTVGQV